MQTANVLNLPQGKMANLKEHSPKEQFNTFFSLKEHEG
jgi:hypothetical protein